MDQAKLKSIVEAALLAAGRPLNIEQLEKLFVSERNSPSREELRQCLNTLASECEDRGYELKRVASGYRYQVRQELEPWIVHLWDEKPPRYSRALLETLALIVYRQPITRAEIEAVRGVSVSTNIIRTLMEHEWVRVIGHKEVPGRPALYASTRKFLDDFNLQSLDELPSLAELADPINRELDLEVSERGFEERGQSNGLVAEDKETTSPLARADALVATLPVGENRR